MQSFSHTLYYFSIVRIYPKNKERADESKLFLPGTALEYLHNEMDTGWQLVGKEDFPEVARETNTLNFLRLSAVSGWCYQWLSDLLEWGIGG